MDTFKIVYMLIVILSSPGWWIIFALLAGGLAALVASWLRLNPWMAGALVGLGTLAVLAWIGMLLNTPLGPPLALPREYIQFWLVLGAGVGVAWLVDTLLLLAIWRSSRRQE